MSLRAKWTLGGLVTYSMLVFIQLETRHVHIAGVTPHPNATWRQQMARNLTMDEGGSLKPGQYLMHDRDPPFGAACQQRREAAGVQRVPLPPRSPWWQAYAERWMQSGKTARRAQMLLLGERSLQPALSADITHDRTARPHQGQGKVMLLPAAKVEPDLHSSIACRERLGGLINYYHRKAA